MNELGGTWIRFEPDMDNKYSSHKHFQVIYTKIARNRGVVTDTGGGLGADIK